MHFGDGTSSQRVFGGNPGMFNRGPTTGVTGTRTSAADILGRPNNRIGSAATLRQAEGIRSGPNLAAPSFVAPGTGVFDRSFIGNNLPIVVDSTLVDRTGMINALPGDFAPNLSSDSVSPLVVPIIVPVVPDSPDTDTTDDGTRDTRVPRAPAESLDPLADPGAQATATAIPTRDPPSERTTRAPAQPRIVIRQGSADFVEVPTTSNRQSTTRRSEATPPAARRATTVTQQYTIWQGYYWHHNPTSGWHYWDGSRWVNFN